MINILLNIIGLLCIVISLYYINRVTKRESNLYDEMVSIYKDIRYYSNTIEDTMRSFNDLIDVSLNKVENLQDIYLQEKKQIKVDETMQSNKNKIDSLSIKLKDSNKIEMPNKEIFDKAVQLKENGLSNKEIAQKLNKGIREVEIILKMMKNI
ncbi:hypothetical protein K8M07_01085 [Schnuerera sp. xch1]|uniref:hypothetical protein n=1 Tax=Schnuerera sp. xch1 TaxID=2874283 RepID=UPI001CBED5B0|nr:hypothetical protein [Schnuerera sp. xch1]MBZ2173846.1 hypothetical protein [Schnuerera sp. xch1]